MKEKNFYEGEKSSIRMSFTNGDKCHLHVFDSSHLSHTLVFHQSASVIRVIRVSYTRGDHFQPPVFPEWIPILSACRLSVVSGVTLLSLVSCDWRHPQVY
jgi:hypothetical protein